MRRLDQVLEQRRDAVIERAAELKAQSVQNPERKGSSRNKWVVWAPDPWMPGAALEHSNGSAIASIEGGGWRRGRVFNRPVIELRAL